MGVSLRGHARTLTSHLSPYAVLVQVRRVQILHSDKQSGSTHAVDDVNLASASAYSTTRISRFLVFKVMQIYFINSMCHRLYPAASTQLHSCHPSKKT